MNKKKPNSLVDRYYTWEKLVLVTALLLIVWQIFGLNDATTLPLLDVKLKDPSKFPFVVSLILAAEFLILLIEWNQSEEVARRAFVARFRFSITALFAVAAIWIDLPTFTKGTDLAEVSRFWFIFYFLIGLTIGALTSVLVFVTLMIRSDDETAKFLLSKIPVATRCVYLGFWPMVLILLFATYAVSCRAPLAVLKVAPWITVLPISYFVIEQIVSLYFCYDAEGHRIPVHLRISKLKEIFKMHDYLNFLNQHSEELTKKAKEVLPPIATPQQQQKAMRDHFSREEVVRTGFPLHDAAFAGRLDLIEQLLANGKSINQQAGNGWSPLLVAVAQGHPKIVKYMLERGANPDIANLQRITPLMYAARYGNREIAKMLLDFGAKLDLQDSFGETALAVAVRVGQEPLVRLFISKGAKIDTRSTLENESPLESAHRLGFGKIARLLRKGT
jgi:hypothetical protein